MNEIIILASKSGVRKKILNQNGIECEVIPANIDEDQVKEAQAKRSSNDYSTNKEESRSLLSGNNEKSNDGIKSEPIKSNKIYGRNTRVSVRYENGSVIKDVKYKKVESDLNDEKCVIIND